VVKKSAAKGGEAESEEEEGGEMTEMKFEEEEH